MHMRKFTKLFLALLVSTLGATNLFAADQTAELEAEMFKAWTSNLPGAEVDPEPANEPKSDGAFGCTYALYENVGAYGTIYGSPSVYYLWYADITGTKTLTVTGTPGMSIRLMLNREPYVEGGTGDADGGAYVELIKNVGDDGTVVFDFTTEEKLASYNYLHLNAIKVPGGGTAGVVKKIELFGAVKPITGWVDMLNNGDLESDDLESFPVSKDGPNNGNTANDRPEIVELDGVKCMKITADDLTSIESEWTTWSTQFYFKFNEFLPEGTQWKAEFEVYADQDANITTSAQGAPRTWQDGNIFPAFDVYADWVPKTFDGTVTSAQAGSNGLGSIAFDLNNSNKPINFFFKNVHFYIYKEKTALGQIKANFDTDVIRLDFGENCNLKDLVKANNNNSVIYPNECVSVKINGTTSSILSVEAREDGYLWVFVNEPYSEDIEDKVEISFTNPADAAFRLKYTAGRYEGEDVKDFTDMTATYLSGLSENVSYLGQAPKLDTADPEDGAFNLPLTMKTFKVSFVTNANAEKIVAKLDDVDLKVAPATGFAKEFTFTLETEGDVAAGEHTLLIDKVYPQEEILGDDEFSKFEFKLNFGPVVIDPNDQQETIYTDDFANGGAGWQVAYESVIQAANSGSGCRLVTSQGSFATNLLYLCSRGSGDKNAYAWFGTEEQKLTLAAKTYHLTFGATRWDRDSERSIKAQIFPESAISSDGSVTEEDQLVAEKSQELTLYYNQTSDCHRVDMEFTAPEAGNYVIRFVVGDKNGACGGWGDGAAIGDIKVEYIPNTVGGEETRLLSTAIENAKKTLENNADERYAGGDVDALKALVEKVEAEMATYYNPSTYKEAAASLDEAGETVKAHKEACDTYDANIKKTCDIVRQVTAAEDNGKPNQKQKFMTTDLFAQVNALAEKYHATSQWEDKAAPAAEGEEETHDWQLVYTFDVLTDNDALAAANKELADVNKIAGGMFTVGASSLKTTGYAALNERIRSGIEALKSLGVAEDDELIVEALKIFGDDDDMAEALKTRLKTVLYDQLKGENNLFPVDEETLTTPSYDMTVFVKNPNMYAPALSTEVPGWTNISGNGFGWSDWSNSHSKETPYAEDCAIHPGWHAQATTEQTVTDLPAGIYTIKARANDNSSDSQGNNLYVKLSSTPAVAEGAELDPEINYAAYTPFNNAGWDREMADVVVVDGQLTIGCTWGPNAQAFFDQVQLFITAPATGFDYGKAHQDLVDAIETEQVAPAKVSAFGIYDLNGRRVNKAQKGISIVKKMMSDGTIVTEKVIVK